MQIEEAFKKLKIPLKDEIDGRVTHSPYRKHNGKVKRKVVTELQDMAFQTDETNFENLKNEKAIEKRLRA